MGRYFNHILNSLSLFILVFIFDFIISSRVFCEEKNIYLPSTIKITGVPSKKQNKSFPEIISGDSKFVGFNINWSCNSLFVEKDQLSIKNRQGKPDQSFLDPTVQKIIVRKKSRWPNMYFDAYSVNPVYYRFHYNKTKELLPSSNILQEVIYIPLSTQYAISPEAFSKKLYTKRFSELTVREAWELMGFSDTPKQLSNHSELGFVPTFSLSGFFYKFQDTSLKVKGKTVDLGTIISLCKEYKIPYVKIKIPTPSTIKHVITNKDHVLPQWTYVGTAQELRNTTGYDIDHDSDFIYHEDLIYQDLGSTYIYEEASQKDILYLIVPVGDKNVYLLLRKLGISITFTKKHKDK